MFHVEIELPLHAKLCAGILGEPTKIFHSIRKRKVPFSAQIHSYDVLNLIQTVWKIHLILNTILALHNKLHFEERFWFLILNAHVGWGASWWDDNWQHCSLKTPA